MMLPTFIIRRRMSGSRCTYFADPATSRVWNKVMSLADPGYHVNSRRKCAPGGTEESKRCTACRVWGSTSDGGGDTSGSEEAQ